MAKTNHKSAAVPHQAGRTVALVYARKSMVKREGPAPASPEMQSEAVSARARDLNLTPELYSDAEGHRSGLDENRQAWQQLRARIADPDVAALIVYSWDRAVRNTKLLLQLADELQRLGVRFISLSDNIDTTSAAGRFQLTVIGGVGEYESRAAAERRVSTINHLRRHRGRHFGSVPFGTERVPRDGDLVLVPSTRAQPNGTDYDALEALYRAYAGGDVGQAAVADRLNTAGWRFRDRRGGLRPFDVKDVRRLLYNHWIYSGHVIIGRAYQGDFEVVKGSHGPILPLELTQAIAARYAGFKRGWKRTPTPYLHPLSSLLECPCGTRLTGSRHHGRVVYIHRSLRRCAQGHPLEWPAEPIEQAVRRHIADLKMPAEIVEMDRSLLDGLLARELSGRSSLVERDRLTRACDRLADLYADGEITRDQYNTKKGAYQVELDSLDAALPVPLDVLAALELGKEVLTAPPAAFRALAVELYVRIMVMPDGTLDYQAQEWAQGWA